MIEVFWFFSVRVFFHAYPVFCGAVCNVASRRLYAISNKLIAPDE